MQIVVFKIGKEQFAVETEKVKSITDTMQITRVPKASDYIKGLINLRGNVISLLNMHLLLELEEENKGEGRIIILELNQEDVGIEVDEVDEVLEIKEDIIKKLEENKEKPYIEGIINLGDRLITLINICKLIPNY
ncbi:chemotaxis protein CheW [Hathewaya histolytica]|uniref:Chemotaxis protein cheW n=1 Tax=Hathewaya histolytica TaxID=1498 RepID=A0A4U9R7R1_HATHI|nr:chemotaxis protein CheW [Hathewaya histolytica]VTQ87562.1 chemotaxis protein cheW [Hathewaya histolytica]